MMKGCLVFTQSTPLSARQMAAPAFISTVLLHGLHYPFTPLVMAVVFSMVASYFPLRTLVPPMRQHRWRLALVASNNPG